MPTTSPSRLTRGPPLDPKFTGASVCRFKYVGRYRLYLRICAVMQRHVKCKADLQWGCFLLLALRPLHNGLAWRADAQLAAKPNTHTTTPATHIHTYTRTPNAHLHKGLARRADAQLAAGALEGGHDARRHSAAQHQRRTQRADPLANLQPVLFVPRVG